jgi:hypothetical protein
MPAMLPRRLPVLVLVLAVLPARLPAQVPLGPEFRVNTVVAGRQTAPAVAADADGNFVVAWGSSPVQLSTTVLAQRFLADGTPRGAEFQVASDALYGLRPAVAVQPSGAFVVVWIGRISSGYVQVFGRRFDADGGPLGPDFRVNESTTYGALDPSLAMAPDGAFMVAWRSNLGVPHPESEALARRFEAEGQAIGGEFLVNQFPNAYQGQPAVAANASGGFGVAFTAAAPGLDLDVLAQAYDPSGNVLERNRRVNAVTARSQVNPAIAAAGGGDFVVAWQSSILGANYEIRARQLTGAGVPRGPEFAVNTFTTLNQTEPAVAVHAGGDFTVAWNGIAQDGSDYGVFAQRLAADGQHLGPEFRVNETTTGAQNEVHLAPLPDGGMVVVWSGTGPGDADGVFARRYGPETAKRR